MIGWKKNQDCPLCKAAVLETDDAFETPSAYFPGLGKPFGDFLEEDDPLQAYCRKRVHVACWLAWPDRARFAAAWAGWKRDGVKDTADLGEAWQDPGVMIAAPADPSGDAARIRLFFPQVAALEEIPAARWPAALDELAARPLLREALKDVDALRRRFPDARALTEAVNWKRKPTPCQICQGILGANPASAAAYRIPQAEFWPSTPDARGLRPFSGALVHTECYLRWPDRERFARASADVERRLAKLAARRAVAPLNATAFLVAEIDPERRETAIELLAGGTRVPVEAARWGEAALSDRLRPFERQAVLEALPALAAKYPTASAFLDSVDWTAKEVESYQALADQIDECRRLVATARQQRLCCPRCVAKLTDLLHEEGGATVECPRCGSDLTPMDFGWLP
jgi:hypothetical protein